MSSSGELAERLAYFSNRRALGLEAEPVTIGPYKLLELIGRGTFGRVWRALDTILGRDVALKLTRASDIDEARSLAAIKSPHVVAVHSIEIVDGHTVTVMELVEGDRLDEWIKRRRPVAHVLKILHQIGSGLEAIHGAGLKHGDVKPSNILVDAHGNAKIVDLGLARVERAEGPVGTAAWGAPEAQHGHADPRSDQYSFGLVCRWALEQAGAEDLARQFCARALREDPRARWSSIAEGLAHLPHQHPRSWRALLAAMLIAGAVLGVLGVRLWPGGGGSIELPEWVEASASMTKARELAEAGELRDSFAEFSGARGELLDASPIIAAEAGAGLADIFAKRAVETTDRILASIVAAAAAEALEAVGDERADEYHRLEAELRP